MLGIVTGLELEAELCRKVFKELRFTDTKVIITSGMGSVSGAEKAAHALCKKGVKHLVSLGVCGGLAPNVFSGDIIIPKQVIMDGKTHHVSEPWHTNILSHMPEAKTAPILSVHTALTSPLEKATAFEQSGAVAVDVESYAVLNIAQAHNIPALVIRAVLDMDNQSLPPAALKGVDEHGKTRIGAVLRELLKRPQDLPDLVQLGKQSKLAKAALRDTINRTSRLRPLSIAGHEDSRTV